MKTLDLAHIKQIQVYLDELNEYKYFSIEPTLARINTYEWIIAINISTLYKENIIYSVNLTQFSKNLKWSSR